MRRVIITWSYADNQQSVLVSYSCEIAISYTTKRRNIYMGCGGKLKSRGGDYRRSYAKGRLSYA